MIKLILEYTKKKNSFTYLALIAISTLTIILTWLPFYLRFPIWGIRVGDHGLGTIIANFDGPYYIAIAKSLYSNEILKQFEFSLPVEYYAAHFPLYSLILNLLSSFMGYQYSVLLLSIISSGLLVVIFYKLLKFLNINHPFFLTLVLLFLPARFFITRAIPSPEPIFLVFTTGSIYYFLRRNYWLSGLIGSLAVLTKPPGILLGISYFIYLSLVFLQSFLNNPTKLLRLFPYKALPLVLMPLSLIALFTFYGYRYGTFWAYFNSGDNIHLFWPPFQVFNSFAYWVGTFWLEDIIWLMIILFLTVIILSKRKDVISIYTLIFVLSLTFVQHRDIARYALPMSPFIIIAFSDLINHKYFKISFFLIIIPVYLYSVNFIAGNTVAISDWQKLL